MEKVMTRAFDMLTVEEMNLIIPEKMSFELPVADACTKRDVSPACKVSRIKSKSVNLSSMADKACRNASV